MEKLKKMIMIDYEEKKLFQAYHEITFLLRRFSFIMTIVIFETKAAI
jgi:hypothetical protein